MSIRTKGKEIIRRALLLCLCAMLAAGCACAEKTEGVNLGKSGKNSLVYGTTLSDGRILLVGTRQAPGQDAGSGWLLCLNPDRTVSWEYTGDAADDECFDAAAELEDGTIGLMFGHTVEHEGTYKYEYALRFFTTDGKPTGKEVSIPFRGDGMVIRNATKSRLQMICTTILTEAGENQYRSVRDDSYLIDWDGNEAASLERFDLSYSNSDMIEEADGLVMNGFAYELNLREGVRKTDLQGNLIWETRLECAWPDTTRADAERIIPAGDGGYIVLQMEPVQPKEDTDWEYRGALVKLDRDGNILWTRTEGFEEVIIGGGLLAMANGKIAVSVIHANKDGKTFRADTPRRIAWFDENGMFLGNVEMEFGTENFPQLKRPNEEPTFGIEESLNFYEDRIIPMEDGMWILGGFYLAQAEKDGTWNNMAYYSSGLFRIPEPCNEGDQEEER